jgi:hypothetical protein
MPMSNDDKDVRNFEALASKTKEQLAKSKEQSAQWLHKAIDTAAEQLEKAGEFTKEEGGRAKEFLKRDLEATREDFANASARVKRALDPHRLGSGMMSLTSHLFESLGDKFKEWSHKTEEVLVFHTGQVTGPGTLTCTDCGTQMHPAGTGRIPPCPKCHKTEFRKSY